MHDKQILQQRRDDEFMRAELRAVRSELTMLRRLIEEGIGAYLRARFPYGDGGDDRWGRHSRRRR